MITIEMLKEEIRKINKRFELELNGGEEIDILESNRLISRTEVLENVIYNLMKMHVDSVNAIVVSDIEWDEHPVKLPTEVRIDINMSNFELLEDLNGYASTLVDYLTDTYECCICNCNNFSIELD